MHCLENPILKPVEYFNMVLVLKYFTSIVSIGETHLVFEISKLQFAGWVVKKLTRDAVTRRSCFRLWTAKQKSSA